MTYTPFTVDKFGGLNVVDDPTVVGMSAATDMLNVDLDAVGRVRSRDGSSALTAATATAHSAAAAYTSAHGVEEILVLENGTVRAYALSNGAAGVTRAATPNSNNAFTSYGVPGTSSLFMVDNTNQIWQYTTIGWTNIVSPTLNPTLLAVTATDNRLVLVDGFSGSRLYFSDAGATTFTSTSWIDLWPGDGETIKAAVRWRDYVFAFKQSKFAVFTGTGTSSTGTPIFNYRSVVAGRGVYSFGGAVAGAEGVYFADSTGIYLTTGDTPQYISRPIEPWLRAGTFGSLPSFTLTSAHLTYYDRRLYVTFPNTTNGVTLVFDTVLNTWTVWKLAATASCAVPLTSQYRGLYFSEHTSKKIAKIDSSVATDQGAAYSWQWTSGLDKLGSPDRKVIRESAVAGSGTVTLQIAADGGAVDSGSALTLDTDGARQRIARRGTYFQQKLSGTGLASVTSITHRLRDAEVPK